MGIALGEWLDSLLWMVVRSTDCCGYVWCVMMYVCIICMCLWHTCMRAEKWVVSLWAHVAHVDVVFLLVTSRCRLRSLPELSGPPHHCFILWRQKLSVLYVQCTLVVVLYSEYMYTCRQFISSHLISTIQLLLDSRLHYNYHDAWS